VGRLSAISVFYSKLILYGAFVWTHRALNSQKRRFTARAVADLETVWFSHMEVGLAVDGQVSFILPCLFCMDNH
jgi:hypothetical protein